MNNTPPNTTGSSFTRPSSPGGVGHAIPNATEEEKKCTCGEPHISERIQHCYDGKPCHVKDYTPPLSHKTWEQRFDNLASSFPMDLVTYRSLFDQKDWEKIKTFISSAIAEAERRVPTWEEGRNKGFREATELATKHWIPEAERKVLEEALKAVDWFYISDSDSITSKIKCEALKNQIISSLQNTKE